MRAAGCRYGLRFAAFVERLPAFNRMTAFHAAREYKIIFCSADFSEGDAPSSTVEMSHAGPISLELRRHRVKCNTRCTDVV